MARNPFPRIQIGFQLWSRISNCKNYDQPVTIFLNLKDLEILIVLLKVHLIVEQCRLAVHLLDGDPGVPHQHVALAQQPASHLWLSVAGNKKRIDF